MASAVVIAGVRSGVGKTTIASGVMGALARRGSQPTTGSPVDASIWGWQNSR